MAAAKKRPAKKVAKRTPVKADEIRRDKVLRVFAAAWLRTGNGVLAYREALPRSAANRLTAKKEAWSMFHDERTQKHIAALRAQADARTGATLTEWLANEIRLTRFDQARLFDEDGNLLPIHEIDPDVRFCIESIELEEEKVEVTKLGETEIVRRTRVKRIKGHSKHAAQDRLGKYLGAFEQDNKQKSATYEEVLRALHGQSDHG